MARLRQIRRLCGEIVREFRPQRVVLFGSHAYGAPTRDSDVDLLVILPFRGDSARKSAEMRLRLEAPFPLDILARPPAMIRRRLRLGDGFIREIQQKGKVLYEAPHR